MVTNALGPPDNEANLPIRYDPGLGFWLVHHPEDVRKVLLDPKVFLPVNALSAVTPIRGQALRTLAQAGVALPPTLANNGTATHPALRRLIAQFLTPAKVRAYRPNIERIAHRYVDAVEAELAARGTCDLVSTLAAALPAEAMLDVFDLQGPYRPVIRELKRWSAASFELFWGWPSPDRQAALAEEVAAFHRWLLTAVETARREKAAAGLFGALAAHRDDNGRSLSRADAASIGYFTLIAGQETTSYLLATVLRHAVGTPELWRRITAAPPLAADVVDDVLRHDPAVTTWRRVTSRSVTLSGVALPAGAELLLTLGCPRPRAASDPAAGAPGALKRQSHLAFGVGNHRCLGADLARLEATVVTQVITRRLPDLRLVEDQVDGAGEARELRLLSFRAPGRVMVRAT